MQHWPHSSTWRWQTSHTFLAPTKRPNWGSLHRFTYPRTPTSKTYTALILNPAFGVREAIPAWSSDTMLINHHLLNAPSVQSVLRTSTPPNQAPLRRLQHPPVDRIMFSLTIGQMSFLIRAGINCLPPPVNLCRWKIHCDPSCPLCWTWLCTVRHILSCCPQPSVKSATHSAMIPYWPIRHSSSNPTFQMELHCMQTSLAWELQKTLPQPSPPR